MATITLPISNIVSVNQMKMKSTLLGGISSFAAIPGTPSGPKAAGNVTFYLNYIE